MRAASGITTPLLEEFQRLCEECFYIGFNQMKEWLSKSACPKIIKEPVRG